jgi:hypothetical protein
MIILVLLLALCTTLEAQVLNPQSVARAGVHDLHQKAAGALEWNPAILGPKSDFKMSFELPSATGAAGNNAFSVRYWNDHVGGDHFLSETDKQSLLSQIPERGLRMNLQAAAPVIGFTYNRFGLRAVVESASQLTMPKDLARLVLEGDELSRRYSLGDLSGESQTLINWAAGFGYQFDQEYIPDLYFGVGFHFYQGLYMSKLERSDGEVTVTDSLINGSSVLQGVTSFRGDGVGFDLGMLATLSDRWEVGLSARQLSARITWDVERNDFISFYTDTTGMIIDSLHNGQYIERAFHYHDTSYGGGVVETQLPPILEITARFRAGSKLTLMADAAYRTQSTSLGRRGIEAGVAGEFSLLPYLPLQAGVSAGGPWLTRVGIGGGLRFKHYELDLGWTWNDGMFNGARGSGFGLANRLKF